MRARLGRSVLFVTPVLLAIALGMAPGVVAEELVEVVVVHERPIEGDSRLALHGLAVERVPRSQLDATIERNLATPGVTAAYEAVTYSAAYTPSDPNWIVQWESMQMEVDEAWDTTFGDPEVVIAVLDTGLDASLPDFQGRIAAGGFDYVNNDSNPNDDDPTQHGTQSAMVAASGIDDGSHNAGFCPRCSILPMKVLDGNGNGTDADISTAIRDAADLGVDIINMSLAGDGTTPALSSAIDYAHGKGVLMVAAAGNEDSFFEQHPAANERVVGVAAVKLPDESDCGIGGAGTYPVAGNEPKCGFSNYGPWNSVAAQGCHVTYATPQGESIFCGTSAAAPAVAGTAGLLAAACPNLSGAQLRTRLENTARDIVPDHLLMPVVEHGRASPPDLVAVANLQLCPDNGFALRQFSFTRTVLDTGSGPCRATTCTNLRLQLREQTNMTGLHGHLFVVMGYLDGLDPRQGPRFTNQGATFFADHTAVRDDDLRVVLKTSGVCRIAGDNDLNSAAASLDRINVYRTVGKVDTSFGDAGDAIFFKHGLKAVDTGLDPGEETSLPVLSIIGVWVDDGDGTPEADEVDCSTAALTSVVIRQS